MKHSIDHGHCRRSIIFMPLIWAVVLCSMSQARILSIGTAQPYATIQAAASVALPGDTLLVHGRTYTNHEGLTNLQGTSGARIYLLAKSGETVIYQGNAEAWHLTDAAYLSISGFVFQGQTGNGVNIDDGGSYTTPSHHVVFDNCIFRDMNASGNCDQLKMSGVDHFEVRNCRFLRGSAGGSGVDMVGCHHGLFACNTFDSLGSNCIQVKGGSQFIRIERNIFNHGGERAVNLGGSTGLDYFRPDTAHFEAADLKVYSNIFIGSQAPIAFVGSVRVDVVNNTVVSPGYWVIRILQETVDPARFDSCGHGLFRNNIVYYGNVKTECNVGPNTAPATFRFSNNLWYKHTNPSGIPSLPVTDSAQLRADPRFGNVSANDFRPGLGSPAIGRGYPAPEPIQDYFGKPFLPNRSIGAIEGGSAGVEPRLPVAPPPSGIVRFTDRRDAIRAVYSLAAPACVTIRLYALSGSTFVTLFSGYRGPGIHTAVLPVKRNVPPGVYSVRFTVGREVFNYRSIAL